jgi:hypothetical protein
VHRAMFYCHKMEDDHFMYDVNFSPAGTTNISVICCVTLCPSVDLFTFPEEFSASVLTLKERCYRQRVPMDNYYLAKRR